MLMLIKKWKYLYLLFTIKLHVLIYLFQSIHGPVVIGDTQSDVPSSDNVSLYVTSFSSLKLLCGVMSTLRMFRNVIYLLEEMFFLYVLFGFSPVADNINWKDVQRKYVVNNVDMSSLRAPKQKGPYTENTHRTIQKHVEHQDATDI